MLLRAKEGHSNYCHRSEANDTCSTSDAEWIPIRPATDSALADAMAWVIVKGCRIREFSIAAAHRPAHMPKGRSRPNATLPIYMERRMGIPKTPEMGRAYYRKQRQIPSGSLASDAYVWQNLLGAHSGYGPGSTPTGAEQSKHSGLPG